MSAPTIKWASLVHVAEVSLVFSLGIVVVFALGVLGLSRLEAVRSGERPRGGAPVGYAVAGTSFVLCAAAALYGIYLIVPQFHK